MNKQTESQLIKSYIDRGYWKDRTLGDFVHDCARVFPQRTALVDSEESLSYQKLDEATDCIAGYLAKIGIKKGDRVLFQVKNCIWHTAALLSVAKVGAIPIMALCTHRLRELASFAQRAEPVAIITNEVYQGFDYPALAHEVQSQNSSILNILTVSNVRDIAYSESPLSPDQYLQCKPLFTDIGLLTCRKMACSKEFKEDILSGFHASGMSMRVASARIDGFPCARVLSRFVSEEEAGLLHPSALEVPGRCDGHRRWESYPLKTGRRRWRSGRWNCCANDLVAMYYRGDFVKQDYEKAAELYEPAI